MADWTSEDWAATMRAARVDQHQLPRGFGPWLGRLLILHPRFVGMALAVLLALGIGLVIRAGHVAPSAPLQEAHPVLEPPAWSPILRPVPSFTLETPLVSPDQVTLSARRHNPGGGREEVFALGQRGTARGFARVVLYRTGSEAGPAGTLFLELARRAAEDGFALLRSARPAPLPTKFGPVETADVVFAGADGEHRCTAWRIVADDQDLRVTGWVCSPEGTPTDRAALACLIDRIGLSAAQTDAGLRTFFKDADRRRAPGCAGPRTGPAIRRPA